MAFYHELWHENEAPIGQSMNRILVIVLACLAIAGCRNSTSTTVNGSSEAMLKESVRSYSIGDRVEGLRVPVLLQAEGKDRLSLNELRGSIVVLEFWATWCGPCIAAIQHLNDVADEFSTNKNIRFISITDENLETVSSFLEKKPIHTWVGLDEEKSIGDAFGIHAIPEMVVINADGKVAAIISPANLNADLLHRIEQGEIIQRKPEGVAIFAGADPFRIEETPPLMQFLLRESSQSSEHSAHVGSKTATTMLARKPEAIISQVFDLNSTTTVFEVDLPDKEYDLIMQFPQATEEFRQMARLAVSAAFNIKTRREMRLVDVFVLRTQPDGSHSLKPTASTGGKSMEAGRTGINVVNGRPSDVLAKLESKLLRPVVDETSIDGFYDFTVKFAKDSSPEEFTKAFTDATGLVIIPSKRELEFTVVESTKAVDRLPEP